MPKPPKTVNRHLPFKTNSGFTLIELIGVMAILAILSAVIAPNIFQAIDDTYAAAETQNLEEIGQNLKRYVTTTKSIPSRNPAIWSVALASVSDIPEEQILNNRRGYRRYLYFDPRFMSTSDTNFNGYNQTAGLTSTPNSPRVMIISDMTRNVPALATDSSVFNAIWDQDAGASVIENNDIKIHRINFTDQFVRVVLSNSASSQSAYRLESASSSPVPAATGTTDGSATRYVISGSKLQLFSTPYPAGSLENTHIVTESKSYRYQDNGSIWYWSN